MPPIYQCHCSLCRKVSGSSSNSALIVEASNFKWCSGEHQIRSFSTSSGFKSEFCCQCGSPVPNISSSGAAFFKIVAIICLLIKQLLFLDLGGLHQLVHSS
nr:GFA family protein [Vibrio navarrensis]